MRARSHSLIIGYVGGYSDGNKKKAALFSLVFVFGLSITFTLLGAAASVMGQFLDSWASGFISTRCHSHIDGPSADGGNFNPLPFQKTKTVKTKGLLGHSCLAC